MSKIVFRIVILSLFAGCAAFAWGPTGHRAASRIAESYLTPAAARAVAELLTPDSLPEVSTWADEIRSDPAWKRANPWHYVNIEDGESYETAKKDPGGNIISQLEEVTAVLKDRKARRQDKVVALKFLVHLVEDIHQPLHVGRASDRGGNNIQVTWHGRPSNLHSVWDSEIIDSERLSFTEFASFIDPPARAQISEWQKSDYMDWMRESFELRGRAYDVGTGQLGYAYSYKNLPLVRLRLAQSAVRLAGVLNSIFR